ncbi:ABC transporter ATP-binding protein [Roseomonas sp. BN140053]|uniref:ABC transporter ATP-binding protein n=1 Tax=Roseomonas sp. BN140053 TaxID=3391898 RepID=UPI0039E78465
MTALLELRGVRAGYGGAQVLHGIDLDVQPGEVVALLGRNGMGKTTTIRTVMGNLRLADGEIRFRGSRIGGMADHRIARLGLGLVPEGREVFPTLTVRENLIATAANRAGNAAPWTLERVLALFPRLGQRLNNLGSQLSGGEQQMLAIGRALMTNPTLLILDEATEGLAPLIRREIWNCVGQLKAGGQSILLVDKNLSALLDLADRHVVVVKGQVAWQGSSAALRADPEAQLRHIGV